MSFIFGLQENCLKEFLFVFQEDLFEIFMNQTQQIDGNKLIRFFMNYQILDVSQQFQLVK